MHVYMYICCFIILSTFIFSFMLCISIHFVYYASLSLQLSNNYFSLLHLHTSQTNRLSRQILQTLNINNGIQIFVCMYRCVCLFCKYSHFNAGLTSQTIKQTKSISNIRDTAVLPVCLCIYNQTYLFLYLVNKYFCFIYIRLT